MTASSEDQEPRGVAMGALPSCQPTAATDQLERHVRVASAGYALLPHTADVIVAAWAPTATGCIEQAVRGLVAVFAEVPNHPTVRRIPYACPPDNDGGSARSGWPGPNARVAPLRCTQSRRGSPSTVCVSSLAR